MCIYVHMYKKAEETRHESHCGLVKRNRFSMATECTKHAAPVTWFVKCKQAFSTRLMPKRLCCNLSYPGALLMYIGKSDYLRYVTMFTDICCMEYSISILESLCFCTPVAWSCDLTNLGARVSLCEQCRHMSLQDCVCWETDPSATL